VQGSPIAASFQRTWLRSSGERPVEWFAQLLFFGIVENVIGSHFDGANRVFLVCACGDDRATLARIIREVITHDSQWCKVGYESQ
jgi:hypothetical protein